VVLRVISEIIVNSNKYLYFPLDIAEEKNHETRFALYCHGYVDHTGLSIFISVQQAVSVFKTQSKC
jgi:hypothetical protein